MSGEQLPPEMAAALAGGRMLNAPAETVELPDEAKRVVEIQAKLRCKQCGERFLDGWQYTYIEAGIANGQATAVVTTVVLCVACSRDDEVVANLRALDALCREPLRFEWLDWSAGDGDDDGEEPSIEDRIRRVTEPGG